MTSFVNPYTFIPHITNPSRGKPAGHARIGVDRLSGVLKVTLTAPRTL
jgi:hypothetical protein